MPTPCFWVMCTGTAELTLRRYHPRDDNPCTGRPGWDYHGATASIGRQRLAVEADGTVANLNHTVPHDDPRWPAACECGYQFADTDVWQVNQERIYASEGGHEWAQQHLPPGAMLDAVWNPWVGPDGVHLVVVLPEGDYTPGTDTRGWWWAVDGPATGGEDRKLVYNAWSRTGDPRVHPPTVSATPSINAVGRYHGFLTDGVLTDNLG